MSKKILIDSGHYTGYNQSQVYKNYIEGNAMWTLHNMLKKELESYGFKVDTTRPNRDKDMGVVARGQMAKGYDMFVSLHSNACDNSAVDRVVIIKGHNMADTLPKALGEELTKVMGVKQKHEIMVRKLNNGTDYYGVLRGAAMVGCKDRILIEHGFHTNLNTAKWLCSEENLKKLAVAEAKIIADYYNVKKPTANTTTTPVKDNKIYRTVIFSGSYDNAVKARNEAIRKGFDAFVVEK